jgi:hypothetical protein
MNTKKGTTKTRTKAAKLKEIITNKGMTTTKKKATIQGDDHQKGDDQD